MNVMTNESGYVISFATVGEIDGGITVLEPEDAADFADNYPAYRLENGALVLDEKRAAEIAGEAERAALNERYIPSQAQSAAEAGRMMLAQLVLDDDSRIRVSGLYAPWAAGRYSPGDVRNYGGQTWECFQAHDNATHPDIQPGHAAWFTFWRPLHGKSPQTARPFVPVQGAHDLYRAGEYAVHTDGKIYACVQDAAYSPDEYPAAWDLVNGGESDAAE